MASSRVAEIFQGDFDDIEATSVSISDVKHLSSYNWIKARTPIIAVPGTPARWSPPKGPQQVKMDSGLYFIAENAVRHPKSPLEPLFRALYLENPSFDIRSIDVVADRNTIRQLLSFINPGLDKSQSFTIHVEVVKNTVILCRVGKPKLQFIKPGMPSGFGHNFEKRYTAHRVKGSSSHYRIISYNFGALKFLIRHETDGYVAVNTAGSSTAVSQSTYDGLSSKMKSVSLSQPNVSLHTTPAGLSIRKDGKAVPLASTLEIKTRTIKRVLAMKDVAAQLWISQTPKLVRAYHAEGNFQPPKVEDVAAAVKSWEDLHQVDLRKLAALIHKVIEVTKGCGGAATIERRGRGTKLTIDRANRERMLPMDLYSKWDEEKQELEPEKS
ncbi:hypothetical protein PEX1_018490 [Penicillium expansum]|uniref:Geranylgeranyl pyrophosphate synthetase n=1 Tax=Penicillium expansum TaxID=27334 RepID=A0A0A2JGW6_PENEN|nr:hypothetical protein PEX2_025690 [Penicillium expansum]KGO49237.1 hypothetical protein PEXP_012860 [Penicillium expansum]KGO54031.1 hypothetical protein PEX2_025690 [Penicillium expansum]KGO60724.1 hypothetical protein PEX1_018490 [Penicillium expansum]